MTDVMSSNLNDSQTFAHTTNTKVTHKPFLPVRGGGFQKKYCQVVDNIFFERRRGFPNLLKMAVKFVKNLTAIFVQNCHFKNFFKICKNCLTTRWGDI